jgi:ADP-ribose pyrophosphatase
MVINEYKDGTSSTAYQYDGVLRKWVDAVVLLLSARSNGVPLICLRSCMRPPLLLRRGLDLPVPDEREFHILLELPAGLLENRDRGQSGTARRASLEALEETGYDVPPADFTPLGVPIFLTPGVLPERVHFMTAPIEDIDLRQRPQGDGSIAEEGGDIVWVSLDEALLMCERGEIVDAKTEVGLRRFAASQP